MKKGFMEVVIKETSVKRLIYALSIRYLLARAFHIAAEFNLGKIIGNESKDFESIFVAISANVMKVERDYLLRLLKFLANHGVITSNEKDIFGPTEVTSFLNAQNKRLIVSNVEWCESGNILNYLNGSSSDYKQFRKLVINITWNDTQIVMKSSPEDMAFLFSHFHLISRALHAIAQMNIIKFTDSERIINEKELSKSLQINIKQFKRLMKILELLKLTEKTGDFYRLSKLLVSILGDSPETLQPAFCMVGSAWWNSVSELKHTLLTRQSAFEKANNINFFRYLEAHPEEQAKFDVGLGCFSKEDDTMVANNFPFSSYRRIVDIGGGYGGLLYAINSLDKDHRHELSLYDQPHVLHNIHKGLTRSSSEEFQSFQGDLFDQGEGSRIPKNKDLYVIKGVLHDFNNQQCQVALKNIHDAMSDESSLLVVERSLRSESGLGSNYASDILMLVLLDGRERSLEEWLMLYKLSGFVCTNADAPPIIGDFSLMLCKKQSFFNGQLHDGKDLFVKKEDLVRENLFNLK